ncbi:MULTISPECIES: VCBS repeat-containing protein [unclassified Yoonia]|uniref:FG-GAP repeat domain-containing protein n=1 Tax=unclassified Yoonia TaxID=2629118 RepID=UPI002AFE4772|nr:MULTISPECIES: VCBS repeat-containing protein [unclassified Yoonia]
MRACLLALAVLPGLAQAQTITDARLTGPTDRYPHGVLGVPSEHDTLEVTLSDGTRLASRWPVPMVFEDTNPRVVDLNGDGASEVIVVQSHEALGAQLAIWGLRDGALQPFVTGPHIGTRFRWLAVAGAADLDGDGVMEIAYVDRPHLARELVVVRVTQDGEAWSLREIARTPGLTNHRIGETDIAGGIRDCGQGPEIITANSDWSRIIATRLQNGRLQQTDIGRHDDRTSFATALRCDPLPD